MQLQKISMSLRWKLWRWPAGLPSRCDRTKLNNGNTAERTPTRLSKHVWSLKDKGIQHEIKWKLRAKTGIYFPGAKYCDTCITEKILILEADRRTCLNLRTEILTKCKHKKK